MFNSNKQIKMVGLQGNTIHCSKSESLSSLGFFVIDAAAFAAAALGVLEAAEVTIGEESESEDSLSSLPKLDSESESFFFLVLDAFFVDATGLADLDTAGFDAVDLTPALALEAGGTSLDPPAIAANLATSAWCASESLLCWFQELCWYFSPQRRHVQYKPTVFFLVGISTGRGTGKTGG